MGDRIRIESQVVFTRDPLIDRIDALHREATQRKHAGEWSTAIACLEEAVCLMEESHIIYPVEQWLRLGLFLQQAGQFDRAMQAFEALLLRVEAHVTKGFGHTNARTRERFEHLMRSTIYDKMRLACQRQKLRERADEYGKLHDREAEAAEALSR